MVRYFCDRCRDEDTDSGKDLILLYLNVKMGTPGIDFQPKAEHYTSICKRCYGQLQQFLRGDYMP